MKTKFSYYAVFESDPGCDPEKDVDMYFPDVPGAFSCGDNFQHGVEMARECLALHLLGLLESGYSIPEPSAPETFELGENETLHLITGDIREIFPDEIAALEREKELVEE